LLDSRRTSTSGCPSDYSPLYLVKTMNIPLETVETLSPQTGQCPAPDAFQRTLFSEPPTDTAACEAYPFGQELSGLVMRKVSELKPLPGLEVANIVIPESAVREISRLPTDLWQEPVTITQDDEVVDRYDIWELAKRKKRETILCLVRNLDSEQAARLMLQAQSRRNCINPYFRIKVALALVSGLREQGKLNQQAGGQTKALSKLTKASRVDTRRYVARLAGVGDGQVTKVQQLEKSAIGEVKDALASSHITIHAGWKLSKQKPHNQLYGVKDVRKRQEEFRRRALLSRRLAKLPPAGRAFVKARRTLRIEWGRHPELDAIRCEVEALPSMQAYARSLGCEL
jgi:hypothetical protein